MTMALSIGATAWSDRIGEIGGDEVRRADKPRQRGALRCESCSAP